MGSLECPHSGDHPAWPCAHRAPPSRRPSAPGHLAQRQAAAHGGGSSGRWEGPGCGRWTPGMLAVAANVEPQAPSSHPGVGAWAGPCPLGTGAGGGKRPPAGSLAPAPRPPARGAPLGITGRGRGRGRAVRLCWGLRGSAGRGTRERGSPGGRGGGKGEGREGGGSVVPGVEALPSRGSLRLRRAPSS